MQAAASPRRFRRSLSFIRPLVRPVVAIAGLALVIAALNAAEPLILKLLFDSLGSARTLQPLLRYTVILVLVAVVREGMSAWSNWLTWRTRLRLHYRLLEAVVSRLHALPLSYLRTEGVGATMTRVDRGIQGCVNAFSEVAFNVLPAVVYLALALAVMLRLEWHLALIALVFAPLPPLIAALSAPEQTRRERTLLERWTKIYARFNEVLSDIVVVKSFVREDEERRRFLRDVKAANAVVVKGVAIDSGVGTAQTLIVALARVVAIGAGGYLLLRKQISLGTLIAFWGYVGGLFAPVQGLSGTYKVLRKAAVSLDTVCDMLDAEENAPDAPNAVALTSLHGEVRFEGIRFAYDTSSPQVLDGIDLRIRPGETVALVGPSGGGKTSMMLLLQRFYDPQEGRILVDGIDLRAVTKQSLRQHIGVVLQDPVLFNESVYRNIAYGRAGANRAEVIAAARAASAHEFIERLPDGYATRVGERGSRLSAGERQRITIARAILKRPTILILDEATSALDADAEVEVQRAVQELAERCTTFVITHRLSTAVSADRILVLRGGRIVEQGRHDDLVTANGYYAYLVHCQVNGLLLSRAA